MVKYNIILDTNCLHTDELKIDDLNAPVRNLIKFIKDNRLASKIDLYIPEIVKEERILKNIYRFENTKNKIKKNIDTIKSYNINIDLTELEATDYEKITRKEYQKILRRYNIKQIKLPKKISSMETAKRYFLRQKPFSNQNDTNGEKGFKDTLIWQSILEFAKTKDNLIFVTNNITDFTEVLLGEFKSIFNKEIVFLENCDLTQKYLDEILDVNSELERQKQKFRNIIEKNFGELMLELHKKREYLHIYEDYSFSITNKPIFFTLDSIYNYVSISLINGDFVEARFKVDAHYLEKPIQTNTFGSAVSRDYSTAMFGLGVTSLIEESPSSYDYITNTYTKTLSAIFKLRINEISETISIEEVKLRKDMFSY